MVFIHNNWSFERIATEIEQGNPSIVFNPNTLTIWIQHFFSEGISRAAVPLFFVFSAYLLFKKNEPYKTTLQKKSKSLLIPFFLWIILNILLFIGIKFMISFIKPDFLRNPGEIEILNWNLQQWFHAFLGYDIGPDYNSNVLGPFVAQLWYVRDLFILVVFSPLLKKWFTKSPATYLFSICFSYFLVIRPIFVEYKAFFYFSIGMLWAYNYFDIFNIADKLKWKEIIPIYLFSWFITNKFFNVNTTVSCFMDILSCLLFLKLSKEIIQNEKIYSISKYLSGFSFFLYAVHMPFLMNSIRTVWLKAFPMESPFFVIFEYFGVNILTILLGTLAGIILKKICPPIFRLLSGGR